MTTKSLIEQIVRDAYGDGEQELPLFDWNLQLPAAEKIIARVGKDTWPPEAPRRRPPRPGKDLSKWRDDIAQLLAFLHERYIVGLDDFQARNDPKRPERPKPSWQGTIVDLDGVEWEADGVDWPSDWDKTFKRDVGPPGTSRNGAPPIKPLHEVYVTVEEWWRRRIPGGFTPNFLYGDDEQNHNAASRFLLAIFQSLDPRYTVVNARGLYETKRKLKRRPKSQRKSKK